MNLTFSFVRRTWPIGAIALALLLGYAVGRKNAPERIVERVEYRDREVVKEVEKKETSVKTDTKVAEKKKTTRITKSDGTKIEVEEVDTSVGTTQSIVQYVDRVRVEYRDREVTKEKTVETKRPDWRVGPTVEVDPLNLKGGPVIGGRIERRIFGPVSLGVQANSRAHVGVGLTVEF